MSTRHVVGSSGEFEITEEGLPVGKLPKEYRKYKRFDLKEYDEWCKKNGNLKKLETIDIMSIGIWIEQGGVEKYDPADAKWREIEVKGWPQPIIDNGSLGAL